MRSGPGGPDQLRSLPPQQGQAVFWRVEHWFAPGRREMVSERQEIKGRIFGPWSRGFSDASFFSFWRPLKPAQRRYPRKHTLSHTHTQISQLKEQPSLLLLQEREQQGAAVYDIRRGILRIGMPARFSTAGNPTGTSSKTDLFHISEKEGSGFRSFCEASPICPWSPSLPRRPKTLS